MGDGLLDGRYLLRQVVGRGGMATVWRGVDLRLGRPVAVKVLDEARLMRDPSAAERFELEARTVARLTHPHVVGVYDVGRDGDTPYLVMELVDGHSLAERLIGGPLPVRDAVAVAAQVCDALSLAHEAGVVHRDIKPENILLTGAGAVKVCDFGIARLVHATSDRADLTGPATALGTSAYMAPEQLVGDQVDVRTDLYALGCLLYAMLTGGPPFTGDSPLGVASQHLHRPAPSVRSSRADVPADLDDLVADLLAKDPDHRPASAGEAHVRLTLPMVGGDSASATVTTSARWPTGRAVVTAPTRQMPTADMTGRREPAGWASGRFTTPAFVTGAVAVLAVVLVGVIVAALVQDDSAAGRAQPPAIPPTTSTTLTAPISTPPPVEAADPATAVAAVTTGIRQQQQAGQLDPAAGRELTRKLTDISRDLAKGQAAKAAEKVSDLRTKLSQLHEDDHLTSAGLDALTPLVDRLAASLPRGKYDD